MDRIRARRRGATVFSNLLARGGLLSTGTPDSSCDIDQNRPRIVGPVATSDGETDWVASSERRAASRPGASTTWGGRGARIGDRSRRPRGHRCRPAQRGRSRRSSSRYAPRSPRGRSPTTSPSSARPIPNWFGIASRPIDGAVYRSATRGQPFTIQSISKPFVYGWRSRTTAATRCCGESASSRPATRSTRSDRRGVAAALNPMVNAGAIVTTGLVAGRRTPTSGSSACATFLSALRRPRPRGRRGGLRVGARHRRPQPRDRLPDARASGSLERRGRGCSTSTSASARCWSTCRDLAVMAATLANGGVNPRHRRARPEAPSTSRACSA